MKTLYDLLGAHPSDNAEALRTAFRKAAKANHPDLHGGDPHAAMRFRQIADAYDVLRNTQRRATYDRLLQFEREQVGWKSKSTASYPMRSFFADAIIAISLAIVLAGGYLTYAHTSKTHAEELAGTGGRELARIGVVQRPAPTSTNKPDERREEPERNAGGSVPGAAGLNTEAANITNAFAITVVRTDPKSAAEHPDQATGSAQLVKVLSSSGERNSDGGKSLSSDFAMSGDKRDMKRREAHDINASDVKISDTKLPARTAAKRQAASRTEIEQRQAAGRTEIEQRQAAGSTEFDQRSLADRNGCSGSCAHGVRPVLGVGF